MLVKLSKIGSEPSSQAREIKHSADLLALA